MPSKRPKPYNGGARGLMVIRLGSSALVRQLVYEKENSELKPVKLRLKMDLVSYPARAEGLVNKKQTQRSKIKKLPVLKHDRIAVPFPMSWKMIHLFYFKICR